MVLFWKSGLQERGKVRIARSISPSVEDHQWLRTQATSASWLNMVERFFRDLTVNRLRRGVFRSVPELVDALEKYIAQHNRDPKPFIWTAKANDILAKVARARKKTPAQTYVMLIPKHYTSGRHPTSGVCRMESFRGGRKITVAGTHPSFSRGPEARSRPAATCQSRGWAVRTGEYRIRSRRRPRWSGCLGNS